MSRCPAEHGTAPLSPRQAELLRLLQWIMDKDDRPPSVRYLAQKLGGIHHSVVEANLRVLWRKGYLYAPTSAGLRCTHPPDVTSLR